MRSKGSKSGLSQKLDSDIWQIVRKLADEQAQYDQPNAKLDIAFVLNKIKRSNSSLARHPNRALEDSIERVLDALKETNGEAGSHGEDEDDLGSIEGEFDGVEVSRRSPVNSMNRSLVKAWGTNSAPVKGTQDESKQTLDEAATRGMDTSRTKKRAINGEPLTKRRKAAPDVDRSPPTHVSLSDMGGVDGVIDELEDLLALPLLKPSSYIQADIEPPRGVLLHGPPGCGKTMIANAFAAEAGVPFINISAPSIVSGMSGESEKVLREHFEEAKRLAPCLLFIDEIDAITPKRETAQREMEKRIVAQFLTCMDDLALEKTGGKAVIVLAATNRPDSLDPALRRAGRFDKEINMGVPSEPVREQILRALMRKKPLGEDIDLARLARLTPGFVGADLKDLVSTAGAIAMKRLKEALKGHATEMEVDGDSLVPPRVAKLRNLFKHLKELPSEIETIAITSEDFSRALPKVQPSSKREGFATIPDTTWDDIGALTSVREELDLAIVGPIRDPEAYAVAKITAPTGVLLFGPPGCGKTLLAKAVANETHANFISVNGPELLNKYVGESERAVRQVFLRARSSVPCIVFFDELDALVPKRNDALSESSARVVNTLLTELDGLSSRKGVYVIAATNRPDVIDPAMLRPGRLGTLLFVDLPGPKERVEVMGTLIRQLEIGFMEQLSRLVADRCDGFNGADLGNLVLRAQWRAFRRDRRATLQFEDFEAARLSVERSVSDRDMVKYERLKKRSSWGG